MILLVSLARSLSLNLGDVREGYLKEMSKLRVNDQQEERGV